jgi:6-phosphofructokinase 1
MTSRPECQTESHIRRVAILFAGGPAPAANAVISSAAASFLRHNIEVVGIKYGYSNLVRYGPGHPMEESADYVHITHDVLERTRNSQGILIGTARTNPGKSVSHPEHLKDPRRTKELETVYDALVSLSVDALVSIGGDDTLKTANKLKLFQAQLPDDSPHIPIVHLPKTIDNDYKGIDFTFGYFTAVDYLGNEIRNLLADAQAMRRYYLVELMGRRAGWLAYGAAIAGEATMMLSVEDIEEEYAAWEDEIDPETGQPVRDPETGETKSRKIFNKDKVVQHIVAMIRAREEHQNNRYGVIAIAEGLAELLPYEIIKDVPRDPFGNISFSQIDLGGKFAAWVAEEYQKQTERVIKVTGLQLGYESRCAQPQAFDVLLGSQLGVGAYRALIEEKLDGVMISVSGQLELRYVPFEKLVDQKSLRTVIRYINRNSDFYRLARFLETSCHISKSH